MFGPVLFVCFGLFGVSLVYYNFKVSMFIYYQAGKKCQIKTKRTKVFQTLLPPKMKQNRTGLLQQHVTVVPFW